MQNEECDRIQTQIQYQTSKVLFHPALINLFQHEDVDENTINVVEDFA